MPNRGHAWERARKGAGFRCVYCRRVFDAYPHLQEHEAACPERVWRRAQWDQALEYAKQREKDA